MNLAVSIGLYRHFKGEYYYVKEITKNCNTSVEYVSYFNICHPEYGTFIRPLSDFFVDSCVIGGELVKISDREDNITGQIYRFERVKDLNFQLRSVSTQTLIEELRGRADSPLQDIAVHGLSDLVAYKDYCVGVEHYATEDYPYGIETVNTFDSKDKALKYFHTHKHRSDTHVFRRVFVREEE